MQGSFSGDWLRQASVPGTPTADRLGDCKVPVLVVCGDADRDDFRRTAAAIASRVPSAHVVDCAGVGHFPNLEAPEVFNRFVCDFLAGHVSPG